VGTATTQRFNYVAPSPGIPYGAPANGRSLRFSRGQHLNGLSSFSVYSQTATTGPIGFAPVSVTGYDTHTGSTHGTMRVLDDICSRPNGISFS